MVTFSAGEWLVRANGRFDEDGNFFVGNLRCYPHRIPIRSWERKINRYLALKDKASIQYDPVLGWAPRPKSTSGNGLYHYNEDAIRTASCDTVILEDPRPGILRIAIFGDSFTHGDDVAFEDTWGYVLEKKLRSTGLNAEVLNFGVGGYGIDQSFLRWEKMGRLHKPKIVILGLQIENIRRCVNLMKPIYDSKTGMPFSKSRFTLEGGRLRLINVPVPAPDQLIRIARDFDSWELSKYEYWYDKDKYRDSIFLRSKLVSFIYSQGKSGEQSERIEKPETLSLAIISEFKKEAEAEGAMFFSVLLPYGDNLNSLPADFLEKAEAIAPLVRTDRIFSKEENQKRLQALIPLHYSPQGNEIVADAVTDFIEKILN
ncbi:MAG TPA: SGNH/GDSL hydrolase family protein [Candidatus Omnitrophota bacterium]|nr:SGNH/GDSL hydrolase family protein [Candidatus Omnitrophota bacterium]